MRGLPSVGSDDRFRTRRWDAVVLGGALPGLIAAIRLGMNGARTLILEEAAAVDAFPGLREPFLVNGTGSDDVLGRCLRSLGIPLIDRQRIGSDPLAYQVVFPDARLDMGDRHHTCEELVTWCFADAEAADSLTRELAEAAAAERIAMLEAPVVRTPRRLSRITSQRPSDLLAPPPHAGNRVRAARGLPARIAQAPPRLAALCAAQIRALSNLGAAAPSSAAQARLLGLSLDGSALFAGGEYWVRELLRRRIEALYGEFRTLPEAFHLVNVTNQPGVALDETGEIWCGRVLILNAPRTALADAVTQRPVPELLAAPSPTRRRLSLHLRVRRRALPEGMFKRVIAVRDIEAPMQGTNVTTLCVFPNAGRDDFVDMVASSVVDPDAPDLSGWESEMLDSVLRLMPFASDSIESVRAPTPRWDSDAWLSDPPTGEGWPDPCKIRISSKPPTWLLDRSGVAGLGFEGDVLLGWRAGDAVAAELA